MSGTTRADEPFGPFDVLGPAERQAVDDRAERVRWRAREPSPDELRRPDHLYVLRSGTAFATGRSVTGHRLMLAVLVPGDVASSLGNAGDVDMHAMEDVCVSAVPRALLASVVAQRPQVALALVDAMSERLAVMRQVAASVGQMRAEDRLWSRLAQLCEQLGRATPEGVVLDLRMTHEQWGRLLGASREAVTLAFGSLRRKGLIERLDGSGLRVPWAAVARWPAAGPAPAAQPEGA